MTTTKAKLHTNDKPGSPIDENLPLSGLVVLDLTLARSGPTCGRHLADWGATVILVQPPNDGGDEVIGKREGADYQNLHRNKRAIVLNLKSPTGYQAFLKLVEKADIVIENMRVAVKHRLKVAYEDLKQVNPRLIYGSISGFGQTGPISHRPGVDQIVQGMGGLMSVTGKPGDGPTRVGIAIADTTAGNLLAMGVLMALYQRERTGKGSWVHTSLLECTSFMLDFQAARYLATGVVPQPVGNNHPTAVPTGTFATSDGYVNLGASSTKQFTHLSSALGHPEWVERPEWKTQAGRAKDREALHEAIGAELAKRPVQHWVEILSEAGIPCGPVYDIKQLFDDPQARHIGLAIPSVHPTQGTVKMVASPLNFDGAEKRIRRRISANGDCTREILQWAGFPPEEISRLEKEGGVAA